MILIPSLKRFATCALLLASLMQQLAVAATTSNYLDIPSLLEGRASAATSPLLVGVDMPGFGPPVREGIYQLSSASLFRKDGGSDGFLVISRRDDGAFTALVSTSSRRGLVIGDADGTQVFKPEPAYDESSDADMPTGPAHSLPAPAPTETASNTRLTVVVGFSPESAAFVKDPTGFALAQLEVANLQFLNSGLAIRVGLVAVESIPVDLPVSEQTLLDLRWQMKNGVAADLISAFFMKRPGDTVAGIAFRNDRYTTQSVETTDTFAHEIAHNAGGKHCNPGDPEYYYGFRIGDKGTSLCRGPIRRPYYSTSEKNDADGAPLGDAKSADMARVWRESLPVMAAYGDKQRATRSFHLINLGNEQCLAGASSGLVQFEKCDMGNSAQKWTEWPNDPYGFFRWAGDERRCLFVDANDQLKVSLVACDNQKHSRWTIQSDGRFWSTYQDSQGRSHYLASVDQKPAPAIVPLPSASDPRALWEKYDPKPGQAVQLRNTLAGLCAQVRNAQYAVGTVVEFASCASGSRQQRWLWDDQRLRVHEQQDLCLGYDGYRAELQLCNWVNDSVLWSRQGATIKNQLSRGCLAAHPDDLGPGAEVRMGAGCRPDLHSDLWLEIPVQ
ncbi:ricin-type beta-trefoil lectin domain protein [Pseudomonas bharatica]|uniref:ricin-type beta-trefoil lectin domain protein n=1 Tax=Pseudomonas bharatica TaxID=2692112 RepID=UPI003B280382